MPEPFKTFFNGEVIAAIATHLARVEPLFDRERFLREAADGLDALELKARSQQIAAALATSLPPGWRGVTAMLAALHPEEYAPADAGSNAEGLRGWAVMPMAEVVAARGLDGPFDAAMEALATMTSRFSAEFAVRPLILRDPERALAHVRHWAEDANRHVRRLASEGTRPRLPWGIRLKPFVADPSPLLPNLHRLRDDPEVYVRRSVANSLNDIAKDHPDLVAAIAADWLRDATPERVRLVRHALRTLVKAGHPGALAALGFAASDLSARLVLATPTVRLGEALVFSLVLSGRGKAVLDYAIHHRRANGGLSPKVFKWRNVTLQDTELRLERRHPIRPVTVRRFYGGLHRLEVLANGVPLAGSDFLLEVPAAGSLVPA